ncbi:MAG: 30S ribosomal protein S8 [Candidatus Glassbacteria bacterium RIFCSPLOWO2_12_FULL_58_11]|uniref:Small ribosomal subunit protein uS8 n=2 Tax=Candidatus Glassiibacteriota TaxID=1817805 RepID=A0A1F5YPI8_9BACT|nr:ribosomal protein S8 [uncultured bacterium]OGF99737.1 MAG: 30S ribosomal protein S8 [Candidatus Glassbacteria bacterium GWA2_58_10]OGG01994.1 MAG: 30S ribosomal protein S8 [Candidatus Glassbacteria bacterium RIFCSPLOWO2_12_FULL_58_11]
MPMTDPIADMLTRIRNGYQARHIRVDVPCSKLAREMARLLLEEKLIGNFREIADNRQNVLRVYLKYGQDESPAMLGSKKVSKPGRRIYKRASEIKRIRNGLGMAIISTSQGLITDRTARKKHVGGEVLAHVW